MFCFMYRKGRSNVGRKEGREEGREEGRKGWREGWGEGGREGGSVGGREGGKERKAHGSSANCIVSISSEIIMIIYL